MTDLSLAPDLLTVRDRPRSAAALHTLVAIACLFSFLPTLSFAAPTNSARHWAFRAPLRPPLPDVSNTSWSRNPIDRFVLERLEHEGLSPSPEVGRPTLLRRLSLDLIGLPPTLDELDAFASDNHSDAFEAQVARLLASPHYGERWGRHWLDIARYADSDGYEKDEMRTVWFYRDWVVAALNRDLAYDRFIIEQI